MIVIKYLTLDEIKHRELIFIHATHQVGFDTFTFLIWGFRRGEEMNEPRLVRC